jgi:hypothetical protein
MPIQKPKYTVEYRTPDPTNDTAVLEVEEVVEIFSGDQLRAELEASKLNLPGMDKAPMNYTALWIWSALTRTKKYTKPAAAFLRTDCLGFEPEGEPEDVDPTQPAEPTSSL